MFNNISLVFLFIYSKGYILSIMTKLEQFSYETNIYSIDSKHIYTPTKDMMSPLRLFKIYTIVLYTFINILIEYYSTKGVNES